MTTKLVPAEIRDRATVRDVTHTELALSAFSLSRRHRTPDDWVEYIAYASQLAAVDHRFSTIASMGAKDYGATD